MATKKEVYLPQLEQGIIFNMAKFLDNNLKSEESFAGYNVGEPDDDIFKIKDNDYPDNIADYIYNEPAKIEEPIAIENSTEATQVNIAEETITEPLEEVPSIEEQNTPDAITPSEQISESDNIWDTFDNNPDIEEDADYQNFASSESNLPQEQVEQNIAPDQEEVAEPDDTITLDDDFKRQLSEQLEAKKMKKVEPIANEDEISETTKQDFTPIDEVSGASYYDLSNFGEDRASERIEDRKQPHLIENIEAAKDTNDEIKEKKKRKVPVLALLMVASVITLIGLAYLIMYYFIPHFYNKEVNITKDSITKKENQIVKELPKDTLNTKDTLGVSKHSNKEFIKDTTFDVKKESKKESDTKIIEEIKRDLAKEIAKTKKQTQLNKEAKEETKNITQNKVKEIKPSKENKVQEKKKEINTNKKQDIVKLDNTKIEPKKEERKLDEVYTIQVYSSPSKEDANDWVIKLKSKSLNPSISEQMIRDVKWYRVRFGNFKTREEAKAVALRYGFSQTWIDRIK